MTDTDSRTIFAAFVIALVLACLFAFAFPNGAHASTVRVLPVGVKYPAAIERYRYQVRRFFPKGRDGCTDRGVQQRALAVLWAESGGNPSCHTGSCRGLFQLNSRYHGGNLYNVEVNIRTAARIYAAQGGRFRPAWTTAARLGVR